MKVKELIKQLQLIADQNAEVQTCGGPIWFIEALPGYYDGCYSKLIFDEKYSPHPIGLEYTREDNKVYIHTLSHEDII